MRMFNKRITCRLLACLLFFNCLPALLFAQGTQAIITGTVVDNKGESVIGATIQVKNESTGFFTGSITNDKGELCRRADKESQDEKTCHFGNAEYDQADHSGDQYSDHSDRHSAVPFSDQCSGDDQERSYRGNRCRNHRYDSGGAGAADQHLVYPGRRKTCKKAGTRAGDGSNRSTGTRQRALP